MPTGGGRGGGGGDLLCGAVHVPGGGGGGGGGMQYLNRQSLMVKDPEMLAMWSMKCCVLLSWAVAITIVWE